MQLTRILLRQAKHENVKRLARLLGLKRDIDTMSHSQLANLIVWLITRREKKMHNLTWGI